LGFGMSGREIPVADIELVERLMQLPLRVRQEVTAGQLSFDWTLPEDTSLKAYRDNLRELRRKRPCQYGHESRKDKRGRCLECQRIQDVVKYRLARGIPLDAPLMSPAEACRRAAAAKRAKGPKCEHGWGGPRDKQGHCTPCRNERRRRESQDPVAKAKRAAYDRARWLARKGQAA
jgi:hypothetical protein